MHHTIGVNNTIPYTKRLSSNKSSHKLLLIDDERDTTNVLKRGLEQAGFSVDVYNDSRQALANFKPKYYDRIVTDIRMPAMNGFELARAIWSIDSDADVCFLTAFEINEIEARKVFSNLKSHCFVKKPIAPSALAAHLFNHLAKS
jgi:DNA-binding response OmpR family regulator